MSEKTVQLKGRTVNRALIEAAVDDLKLEEGWRARASQKFVVVLPDGREVPPKALMSQATGLPVYAFSGGADLNKKFERLGFEVRPITHKD
jgi:hypothetical protein